MTDEIKTKAVTAEEGHAFLVASGAYSPSKDHFGVLTDDCDEAPAAAVVLNGKVIAVTGTLAEAQEYARCRRKHGFAHEGWHEHVGGVHDARARPVVLSVQEAPCLLVCVPPTHVPVEDVAEEPDLG